MSDLAQFNGSLEIVSGVAGASEDGLSGGSGQYAGWVDRSRFTPEDGVEEEPPPQQVWQHSLLFLTQALGPSCTFHRPTNTSTCETAIKIKSADQLRASTAAQTSTRSAGAQ